MPIKTFKHKDNEVLESKVNDWLSYKGSDFDIKNIDFKLGKEENDPITMRTFGMRINLKVKGISFMVKIYEVTGLMVDELV